MTHEINITDFAAFCRSKGEEAYNANDIQVCAFAQFAKSRHPDALMSASEYASGGGRYVMPKGVHNAVCDVNSRAPNAGRTFDQLADRLEALMETADA